MAVESDDFPADAVEVGRVLGAWGIKGWIKVQPFATDPQALFSSKRYQRNESELVIIVTPRLVQPAAHPNDLSSPLETLGEPTEDQFFLLDKTAALPASPAAKE